MPLLCTTIGIRLVLSLSGCVEFEAPPFLPFPPHSLFFLCGRRKKERKYGKSNEEKEREEGGNEFRSDTKKGGGEHWNAFSPACLTGFDFPPTHPGVRLFLKMALFGKRKTRNHGNSSPLSRRVIEGFSRFRGKGEGNYHTR